MRLEEFDKAHADGLVSRSDRDQLSLYSYTAKVAHERLWTPITRAARGIIFDRETGNCVARPFEKFFNLGELPETQPEALPADGFTVEEKLDGSLGIIFYHDGRWDITTKGSFDSEQAEYARSELLSRYRLSYPELTICAEILYPENRIVVDYGERRELVLLAAFWTKSGKEVPAPLLPSLARDLGMPLVDWHEHRNLLDLPHPEENHEGYVVRFATGQRVKVKSPKYVRIHRLLEYRSPRRILDMIEDGSYESIRAEIPDEIAGDFDDVSATLRMAIRQVKEEAAAVFEAVRPLAGDRKAFALKAKESASSRALPLVFALLDGKDTASLAIKAVRRGLKRADV